MLYSEKKERENRFKLALKVAVPFSLVLIFVGYVLFKGGDFTKDDIALFIILLLCYVYYTVYLIYFGFKKTLIDPITKVFIREEILEKIDKQIKNKENVNIVLISIKNMFDINERYGHKNGDEMLGKFVNEFNDFMENNKIKNLAIGRFTNGNFIFSTNCKNANLYHLLNMFQRKTSNQTINGIELKIEYAVVKSNYDNNLTNIINALFYQVNHKNDDNFDLEDTQIYSFENSILNSINDEKFIIKYQTMKESKGIKKYINLIPKLSIGEQSFIKNRILDVILQNNYEFKYDMSLIKYISKNIYFKDIKDKIFIEIFPTTLRNNQFKNEILKLIDNNLIDPKKIVFEFNEKQICNELKRFSEIIYQFKELEFSFALSQFGGSNASFEYFKYLDIDYIIYDMEFNKNFYNPRMNKIFTNLNKMCNQMEIETIVRFVDKKPFYDDLANSGIDFIQGFCIDKPTNIENLRE